MQNGTDGNLFVYIRRGHRHPCEGLMSQSCPVSWTYGGPKAGPLGAVTLGLLDLREDYLPRFCGIHIGFHKSGADQHPLGPTTLTGW